VLSPNITTFRPLLFEAVHAAGLAAAHNVGEGVREIGVVVDRRMFNYKAVVNSFILGANEVRRVGFDIHVRYVDARSPAESRQALNEFRGMGIDTVFSYIDTEHAIRYAEQIGMSVVGYANNIAELAPTKHIAGFSFNANNYLAEQISMLYHDNFFPRGVIGGLATGHVRMSELNTNRETVQYETIRLTNTLRDRVINGTVDIFADETMDNFGTVQIPNGAVLTASEILEMQWLEYSVGSNFEDITVPRADIPIVPLFIRRGAVAEAAWQEYLATQSQGDSPQ
jgi:basic membrane lipoprotein Med (substrate-binding protein (PBP1-ABC) superfamily)